VIKMGGLLYTQPPVNLTKALFEVLLQVGASVKLFLEQTQFPFITWVQHD